MTAISNVEHHLYLNPKSIFDDDGETVMAVNAWSYPPAREFIEDRQRFYALIERLRPAQDGPVALALDDADREILHRLERVGIVLPDPIPDEVEERKLSRGASLGCFQLEVEVGEGCEAQLEPAAELMRSLARRIGGLQRVICRFTGRDPLQRPDSLSALMRALGEAYGALELPAGELPWEIVTPLDDVPEDLEAMLDTNGNVRLVVVDRSEFEPAAAHPTAMGARLEYVRHLSRLGFSVPVEIPTRFPDSLTARVERWLDANEDCGIRLLSRVETPDDRVRADRQFERLTARIAHIAHLCEPWRTLLVSAVNAGWGFVSWDKEHSALYLSADGRWARSPDHAQRGLWGSLEELQPLLKKDEPIPRSASQELTDAGHEGWPDCPRCGYSPLCERYWTTGGDATRRVGDVEQAALHAGHACDVRMRCLTALLEEWRREGPGHVFEGGMRLRFDDGIVRYLGK